MSRNKKFSVRRLRHSSFHATKDVSSLLCSNDIVMNGKAYKVEVCRNN